MKIYRIAEKEYFYTGSCCDTDDGMEVYRIVEQDDWSYPEEEYFHNPKNKISEKEFYSKVESPKMKYDWWGWNKELDIIFGYSEELDIHDFYEKPNSMYWAKETYG